jgi:hypothetical protein
MGTVTGKVTSGPGQGRSYEETWTATVTLVRDRYGEPVRPELDYKLEQGTINYEISGELWSRPVDEPLA